MAMEIMNNVYSNYAAQSMAGNSAASSTKKMETENSSETAGSRKAKSTTGYANELAKLVPSVEFRVGNACVSDKSGKSLTVNPKLLEKMQNDPEKEKDMKDMIKGVESMSKLAEGIAKATGWTIVYQHSYIDENGKYHCRMQTRNDFMLNMSDKLREERRQNSEKLIEKSKEKAEEKSAYDRAEQLINEKMASSKDGTIYLDDTDIRTIIEAVRKADSQKEKDKAALQPKADDSVRATDWVNVGKMIRDEFERLSSKAGSKRTNFSGSDIKPKAADNAESTSDYLSRLQKQVPYMTLEIGNGLSMTRDNKVNTLAVNPKLLEKMQSDPEKAKEYTQRLKDIENAQKFVDGYMKAKGSTTKFSHWYVDENGNYSHIAYYEHDNTFYKKLSERSRENIEKHIEKTREKTVEKQKELQEKLEEKMASSKDGMIYLNDTDIRAIIEAAREEDTSKAQKKEQQKVGANLDFKV